VGDAAAGCAEFYPGLHRSPPLPGASAVEKIAEARQWGGKKENAGAKMFANKILFLASAVSMVLYFSGSGLWVVPCAALIVFSFLEWALSFCVACWAYGFWYQRFPPNMQ
jgi:hypothetical protein